MSELEILDELDKFARNSDKRARQLLCDATRMKTAAKEARDLRAAVKDYFNIVLVERKKRKRR